MSHQLNSVARLIGNSYAHLQHGIDRGIEWGFSKMQEQADATPPKKIASKTPTSKAVRIGKGILGFVAAAGNAYFKTYEELKKKAR